MDLIIRYYVTLTFFNFIIFFEKIQVKRRSQSKAQCDPLTVRVKLACATCTGRPEPCNSIIESRTVSPARRKSANQSL